LLFFCYALIVSISRVIIDTHYVSDVIAGAYIGVMTVFFLAWICRHYESKCGDIAHGIIPKTSA
jgi:membrane-associated phospholipid phosphatase